MVETDVLDFIDELSVTELAAVLTAAELPFDADAERLELCELVETAYTTGAVSADDIFNLDTEPFRR